MMFEYVQKLFETEGYIPHGQSYLWQPGILISNVVGAGLTALACFSIMAIMFFFSQKRKDFGFNKVIYLFAAFLFLCGLNQLVGIITIWAPVYSVQGILKVLGGSVAILSAFMLFLSLPKLIRIPGQKRLEKVNARLRSEIAERERAQVALREANEALETRVQQRTAQLIKTNRDLEREIEQRKKTEQDLKDKNLELLNCMRINDKTDNMVQ